VETEGAPAIPGKQVSGEPVQLLPAAEGQHAPGQALGHEAAPRTGLPQFTGTTVALVAGRQRLPFPTGGGEHARKRNVGRDHDIGSAGLLGELASLEVQGDGLVEFAKVAETATQDANGVGLLGEGTNSTSRDDRLLTVRFGSVWPARYPECVRPEAIDTGLLSRCSRPDQQLFCLIIGRKHARFGSHAEAVEPKLGKQASRPHRFNSRIDPVDGLLKEHDGLLSCAGGSGGLGRAGQQPNAVQPGRPVQVGQLFPQFQGALVVAKCLREGIGVVGGLARLNPCWQCPGGLAGRVPVHGQLASDHRRGDASQRRLLSERLSQASMQAGPLAGQQVGVDHLTKQGMTNVVAVPAGRRYQELASNRGVQSLDQGLVVQAGHECQ
jgi:hypothetical protein